MIKKNKLIEARNNLGYSQECVAAFLEIDVSNYSRKENGKVKISYKEWRKLAEILEIPLENIFESDEGTTVIFRDNASNTGNVICNDVFNYSVIPHSVLESQKKYIEKLEEENRNLKEEKRLLKGE